MKKTIMGLLVGALGFAGAGSLALSGASCGSPTIQCVVGHSVPYAVKYELVEGSGSCSEIKGDELGAATFLQTTPDGTFADYNTRKIAIQSVQFGNLLFEREVDAEDIAYGFGDYTSYPDSKDICYAGGANGTPPLGKAVMKIAEVPPDDKGEGALPAVDIEQEWKNVKIYVTAGAPGTQISGEMTYRDNVEGCQASYKFVALWPSVACGVKVDKDGNPDTKDDITTIPDDGLCDPLPNEKEGRLVGSGINPDFKVKCDPDTFRCILSEPPLTER